MQRDPLKYDVYTCHKQVRAMKINTIEASSDGSSWLLSDGLGAYAEVDRAWVNKHMPEGGTHASAFIGGYFILYPDGYESWSPGQAFSEGYTKNPEVTDVNPRGSVHPDDPAA